MKRSHLFELLLVGICLWACTSTKIDNNAIIIKLDENIKDVIPYSTFVDSITYISLETNDECLVGDIRDVIIADSLILVLNRERSSIYIFDNKGKYMYNISHVGNGPGEYNVIQQFFYNKERNSISIVSYKIIEYDLHGNLQNEFKLPFYVTDLHQFDNGDYLLSRIERIDEPEDVVILTDSIGNIKEKVLKKNSLYNIECTDIWEFASYNNEAHFISPQLDHILYSYSNQTKLKKQQTFIFKPEVSSDFFKKKPKTPGLGENYYRTSYRESENWISLTFWSQTKDLRTFIYNKKEQSFLLGIEFKNDIDNNKEGSFLSASENNTFTNYLISENEDCNPIIQILHLK